MSPEEGIAQYQTGIEQIRERIAWLRCHSFRLGPNPGGSPGMSTEELIAQEERTIERYEEIIARLEHFKVEENQML